MAAARVALETYATAGGWLIQLEQKHVSERSLDIAWTSQVLCQESLRPPLNLQIIPAKYYARSLLNHAEILK